MAGGLSLSQLAPLAVMMALQQFDLEALGYLLHARIAFAVVQVICLSSLVIVRTKIAQMDEDGPKILVPAVKQFGQEIKPAVSQTAREHDLGKWSEQLQQLVIGGVVLSLVHAKWGYVLPVVLQTVTAPLQLIESPLVRIHLLGAAASGDLRRPFPVPSPFGLPFPEAPEEPGKHKSSSGKGPKAKKDK